MAYISEWLALLDNRPAPVGEWATYRRDEALQLLRHAEKTGDWITLSNYRNGFVREVAVRELIDRPSPGALVALIERLNDWVPQVRDLAKAGLARYLSPTHVPALLFALEDFMALALRHRADHAPTLKAVRAVLQSVEADNEVYTSFLTRQGRAARYLFTLLLEKDGDRQTLLRDALAHRELTVRLLAVTACHELPNVRAVPLLREALLRPGAKVRVCVLRALLPLLENPQPTLCTSLLDASPSIRSLARWVAPSHGVDAHSLLVERLNQDLPTARREWLGILGLAKELGVELEHSWLAAAARSDYPDVRRGVIGLLGEGQVSLMLAALDDPSDAVFMAAAAQLDKQPWNSLKAELDARFDRDWHELPTTRRRTLMQLRPRWQQASYLIGRLTSEPVAQVFWAHEVDLWCEAQYQIVDPITSRAERGAIIDKLRNLASRGLISSSNFARVV